MVSGSSPIACHTDPGPVGTAQAQWPRVGRPDRTKRVDANGCASPTLKLNRLNATRVRVRVTSSLVVSTITASPYVNILDIFWEPPSTAPANFQQPYALLGRAAAERTAGDGRWRDMPNGTPCLPPTRPLHLARCVLASTVPLFRNRLRAYRVAARGDGRWRLACRAPPAQRVRVRARVGVLVASQRGCAGVNGLLRELTCAALWKGLWRP